jgi:outer membrane protein TolC
MRFFRLFPIVFVLCTALLADNEAFFPQSSYFKNHFKTTPTKVELEPPARLSDYVADGKLELSLKNFLDLAMANNPDITIQKVSVERQVNAILRAFGPFDPFLQGGFNTTRSIAPSSTQLNGAATLNQLTQPFYLNYNQTLETGLQYSIGYQDTKLSSNSQFNIYNPSYTSNLTFGVTQPLIRGRGSYITRLPITIARSNLRVSEYSLEDQIIQLLTNAELAYWAVVEARENVRVQEKALELADISLKRSKRELELGAISSLEIFQPEANYANAQIFLSQARYALQLAEDALKRQIGADLDPQIRDLPIVLTESPAPPAIPPNYDKEKTVEHALARRPDLKAQGEAMVSDDLSIRLSDNAMRPDLALTFQYGTFGQGGMYFPGEGFAPVPGGFPDAFTQMFGFGYPTYGFGVRLRLPIKDRTAAANLADAVLNKKLDTLRQKSIAQNARLQVLQAISQVESSKASVDLAKVARDLAQKRVDAEQKRYELGTTTIFFVLAAQTDLTTAESTLVRESINYKRNLLQLSARTGDLLDERGIRIQ